MLKYAIMSLALTMTAALAAPHGGGGGHPGGGGFHPGGGGPGFHGPGPGGFHGGGGGPGWRGPGWGPAIIGGGIIGGVLTSQCWGYDPYGNRVWICN